MLKDPDWFQAYLFQDSRVHYSPAIYTNLMCRDTGKMIVSQYLIISLWRTRSGSIHRSCVAKNGWTCHNFDLFIRPRITQQSSYHVSNQEFVQGKWKTPNGSKWRCSKSCRSPYLINFSMDCP